MKGRKDGMIVAWQRSVGGGINMHYGGVGVRGSCWEQTSFYDIPI